MVAGAAAGRAGRLPRLRAAADGARRAAARCWWRRAPSGLPCSQPRPSRSACTAGPRTGSPRRSASWTAAVRHRRRRRDRADRAPVAAVDRPRAARCVRRRCLRRRRDDGGDVARSCCSPPGRSCTSWRRPSRTRTAPCARCWSSSAWREAKIWGLRLPGRRRQLRRRLEHAVPRAVLRRRLDGAGARLRADRHAHRRPLHAHAARAGGAADHHAAVRDRPRR